MRFRKGEMKVFAAPTVFPAASWGLMGGEGDQASQEESAASEMSHLSWEPLVQIKLVPGSSLLLCLVVKVI